MFRFTSLGWLRETVDPALVVSNIQIEEYVCTCCKELPCCPNSLAGCGHLICEDCLLDAECKVEKCPSCGMDQNKVRSIAFEDWSASHRNFFKQIQVRCKDSRCNWVGSVCNWADHTSQECEYREVLCRFCLTRITTDQCIEHANGCTFHNHSF